MTIRERKLMFALIGAVGVVVVAIVFMQWFWTPFQQANRDIERLDEEVNEKIKLISEARQEQKRLAKYKLTSLPHNPDQASADYAKYLKALLRLCGLTVDDLQGPSPNTLKAPAAQGKKAAHLTLAFSVRARGDIAGVVRALKELKVAPIAHRVKSLSLSPAEANAKNPNKLNVTLAIEALIVHKAGSVNPFLAAPDGRLIIIDSIAALRSAPVGLALGSYLAVRASLMSISEETDSILARNYTRISDRDPFKGAVALVEAPKVPKGPQLADLPPFNILEYIKLDHASLTPVNEAFLRNYVFREPEIRLRPKTGRFSSGFDVFVIRNEEKDRQLVRGKVLRVDQRDVYFQVGEDVYGIHIGHSVADAMKRSLSDEEMKQLELTSLYDKKFAEEEMSRSAPAKAPQRGSGKNSKTK